MVTLETVLNIIPALSVLIALFYYTQTLRNAEKTKQKEQVQLRIQSADQHYHRAWTNVMFKEASNNEEWNQVYDPVNNPELFADMIFIRTRFQSIGVM